MNSNGEKNTGIMAHSASSPLSNATKVFLVYCSSDSHAGNRSAGDHERAGSSDWHFRGKEIVRAVVTELAVLHGMKAARSFLLTGGSAGGMATINNADYVRDLVTAEAPGVALVAMPDSGYFQDVMPLKMCDGPDRYECRCAAASGPTSGAPPPEGSWMREDGHSWLGAGQTLAQQAQAMAVFSQGLPDASCSAYYGEWGSWRCYLGQYAAPFLETPTLFLQNQVDEWQG